MLKLQFHYLAPLTAIAVLVMMQGWKATLPDASVGVPFRARVKEAIAQFPLQAGPWEGVNIPLPQEAVALLHPSAYLSRQYTEVTSGDRVAFLVIEAEDARDMMGHYPPNCYPANGWDMIASRGAANAINNKAEWIVGDLHIRGREYEFRRSSIDGEQRLWVRSFFVLPNAMTYPDIGSFGRAAADFQIRPYGATQVQVVYEREYTPEDRERLFDSLIEAHRSLINTLRSR